MYTVQTASTSNYQPIAFIFNDVVPWPGMKHSSSAHRESLLTSAHIFWFSSCPCRQTHAGNCAINQPNEGWWGRTGNRRVRPLRQGTLTGGRGVGLGPLNPFFLITFFQTWCSRAPAFRGLKFIPVVFIKWKVNNWSIGRSKLSGLWTWAFTHWINIVMCNEWKTTLGNTNLFYIILSEYSKKRIH